MPDSKADNKTPGRFFIRIILISLVFAALFYWANKAVRYHIRIDVNETSVTLSLDGKKIHRMNHPEWHSGYVGLELNMPGTFRNYIPEADMESKWDRITVRDNSTGRILMEDRFDDYSKSQWRTVRGKAWTEDGLLKGRRYTVVEAGSDVWRNYTVEAVLVGGKPSGIKVLAKDSINYVGFVFNGSYHSETAAQIVKNGRRKYYREIETVPSPEKRLALLLIKISKTYGWALTTALVTASVTFVCLKIIFWSGSLRKRIERFVSSRTIQKISAGAPFIIAAPAITAGIYIILCVLDGMPHIPDSAAYLFQAKIFADGGLWADAPPYVQFFMHTFLILDEGRIFTHYPFGFPAVLATGVMLGIPWLVTPVLGGLNLVLTAKLGKVLYDRRTGNTAALLGLVSPFFMFMNGTFMSHPAGLFFTLAVLYFAFSIDTGRPLLRGAAAGASLGLLAAVRPLNAAGMGFYLIILIIWKWLKSGRRKKILAAAAGAFLGTALTGILTLLHNKFMTGDPFFTPYELYIGDRVLGTQLGLFGGKSHDLMLGLSHALLNTNIWTSHLMISLFRWPAFIVLAPLMIPLLKAKKNVSDRFMALGTGIIFGLYFFYRYPGVCYGPRYYYEALPFLLLLTARGILWPLDAMTVFYGKRRKISQVEIRQIATALSVMVVAVVVIFSLRNPSRYDSDIARLRKRQNISSGILNSVRSQELQNAVVFVLPPKLAGVWKNYNAQILHDPGHRVTYVRYMHPDDTIINAHWMDYGSVWPQNSPNFDGPVVYARYLGKYLDRLLMDIYPDRDYYVAFYPTGILQPYENTLVELGSRRKPPEKFSREKENQLIWISEPCGHKVRTTLLVTAGIGDVPGRMNLYVNHKYALTLDFDSESRYWTGNGVSAFFQVKSRFPIKGRFPAGRCGVFYLTVSPEYVIPNEPLCVKMVPLEKQGAGPYFVLYEIYDTYKFERSSGKMIVPPGGAGKMTEGLVQILYTAGLRRNAFVHYRKDRKRKEEIVWFYYD